jgi:hypothetical protein
MKNSFGFEQRIKCAPAFILIPALIFISPGCKNQKTPTTPETPAASISVTPTSLSFSGTAGGANPSSKDIQVWNAGGSGTLSYNISDDANWLDVEPKSGSSTGDKITHTVSLNTSGLAEGTHSATITIADPKAGNSPQKVSVELVLSKPPSPKIGFSPASLSFLGTVGGSNPDSQEIQIWNSGEGGTLNYGIAGDAGWLNVAPNSGSSSGDKKTHTAAMNTSGLDKGTYTATITISDPNASNTPQKIGVTLTLAKELLPKICVLPPNLSFTTTLNGPNPPQQEIKVWNCGDGGTLNYGISDDAAWLIVLPINGTSTGDKVTHYVLVNTSGLGEGNYMASITVSDPKAVNGQMKVDVSLRISKTSPPIQEKPQF